MARIPYPDIEQASASVRATFDAYPVKLNVFRMLTYLDESYTPLMQLGAKILTRQALSARLRELAVLRVVHASQATYAWRQHVQIGRDVGLEDAQIEAIEQGELSPELFDETERDVLAFTDEVLHAVRPGDATLAAVERHLSPREVVELTATIGFYMMMSRLMEVTGIEPEDPAGARTIESLQNEDLP